MPNPTQVLPGLYLASGSLAAEATFDLGTIASYHLTALPPSAPLLSSYYHSWQCRLVGHQVNVLTYAWFGRRRSGLHAARVRALRALQASGR